MVVEDEDLKVKVLLAALSSGNIVSSLLIPILCSTVPNLNQ
jgi:hypothetical protein